MHVGSLAAADFLTHVVDHPWKVIDGASPFSTFTLMSNHVFMMLLAALLLMLLLPWFTRIPTARTEIDQLTPRGGRNAVETICTFLRDFVARPNMGEYTDRFIPYIWTVFFFILTVNLLGLLPLEPLTGPIARAFGLGHPVYGTATGNIWVTGTLATCTLLMIIVNGLRLHGMMYVRHFFMGPFPISVVIAFLELVGLVAKTFALSVRLFANMMAGHILLAVLVGFIASAGAVNAALGFGVAIPVVLGGAAVTLLEIFVGFLQAFIFTFLSCVFIGQAVNLHHDEQESHNEVHGPHGEPMAHP